MSSRTFNLTGSLRGLTEEEIKSISESYHFDLTNEEIKTFADYLQPFMRLYERLDVLPEPKLPVKYPRDAGHFPTPEENPYGAWAWKCSIKGAEGGILAGKKVAVKDVVAVAGLPITNGSRLFEGFISDVDATIVTRILDAGGEIAGKAMNEALCWSGGSHTSYPWVVKNPHNPEYMAGGSSSGSAALVAAKQVDMSTGGDQAGSIRIPASICGVYGLKPTWGLIPYSGILSIEFTLDNTGPLARTAHDLAILLEAIAGRDGIDSRQVHTPTQLPSYSKVMREGIKGLRIGVLKEGFGWEGVSEPDVDETVRNAAASFEKLGAKLREVSVPMHRDGLAVWTGFGLEGNWSTMIRDEGMGRCWNGYYDTHFVEFYGPARRARAVEVPPHTKALMILAHYMAEKYSARYYGKAQNLRRVLREEYNKVLEEVDLLLLPTIPLKPKKHKPRGLVEYMEDALDNIQNTCPFDVSYHPALSVPCGFSAGLPVGMMLVGRFFEEPTLLRAAYAFEQR